jgi:hypothetical protein
MRVTITPTATHTLREIATPERPRYEWMVTFQVDSDEGISTAFSVPVTADTLGASPSTGTHKGSAIPSCRIERRPKVSALKIGRSENQNGRPDFRPDGKGPVPVSDVVRFENGSLSFGGAAGKRLHGYAVATLNDQHMPALNDKALIVLFHGDDALHPQDVGTETLHDKLDPWNESVRAH